MRFPQAGLDRLSERIASGEAVFFVGSGFSFDSEGNDTYCLICRLLIRFDALTKILQSSKATQFQDAMKSAIELRQGLMETFNLSESQEGYFSTSTQISILVREYYTFNDWITSAFALLLGKIDRKSKISDRIRLIELLHQKERELLDSLAASSPQRRKIRLSSLAIEELDNLLDLSAGDGGKALFLETMGFADPEVMAGAPHDLDSTTARVSYDDRLRSRHRVLAWLAREGLASTLLTTNFDLLLEGAYRMAGLVPRIPQGLESPSAPPLPTHETPPATFDSFYRIASATQFFGRGDDRHSAHLLKIHGCAEVYRWARTKGKDFLCRYLPAIVFTFREIQNWREDSWSRDLVSTLLRTRSIVFCGYSTADPVLHDTIRTVYEEMARRHGSRGETQLPEGGEAPAFFLGGVGKTEFYGMEILRAASRAVGRDPGLTDHPNYIRFNFLSEEEPAQFPNLDEIMRWLYHLTFRRRQVQALEGDLGRVVTTLLGHPCPEAERKVVLEEFRKLVLTEKTTAEAWKDDAWDRFAFERTIGWTERFQSGLLREFAFADRALRSSGPGWEVERLRRSPWYYPALDHMDWTAWGAVLELALRRRISAWQGVALSWEVDRPWISPATGIRPSVMYSKNASNPTPFCLSIFLRTPGGQGFAVNGKSVFRKHLMWELDSGEIPWRREDLSRKNRSKVPDAATIWNWAHKPLTKIARECGDWLF